RARSNRRSWFLVWRRPQSASGCEVFSPEDAPMMISRRNALMSALFGAGYVGVRALATGLPASLLLNPRRALSDEDATACADKSKAQYVIFSTSSSGDPINASAPGTYSDSKIVHSPDPALAPKTIKLGNAMVMAGGPWSTLPQTVLDR